MNVNYAVRNIEGHGRALVASRAFEVGECIVVEPPLGTIGPTLGVLYNDEAFFDQAQGAIAQDVIADMYERMTGDERARYDNLHNAQPQLGRVGIFATNVIRIQLEADGQDFTLMLVHHVIAQANNSCRPNAYYSYDSEHKLGRLHALHPIAANDEIFIEYGSGEGSSLRNRRARLEFFRDNYGFECDCEACQGPRSQNDSKLRTQAGNLHKQIQSDITTNTPTNAARLRYLKNANDYIRVLRELRIADYKLGSAFLRRAVVHISGHTFHTWDPDAHSEDCANCAADGTPWRHLRDAMIDLWTATRIFTNCFGGDHWMWDEVPIKVREINELLKTTPFPPEPVPPARPRPLAQRISGRASGAAAGPVAAAGEAPAAAPQRRTGLRGR